ncbi:MAG TPA: GNAT family N-acetyltransferase [Rhizomicrobium sp.]|jgi:GNAT superfamily N-acetyltransferase|nr:GNAT family N-acetyltransferase [Rhizomicrobium sp.]
MIVKEALTDADIVHLYPAMRELRPHIKTADEFLARVRRQQAGSGWRLIYVEDAGTAVAAAGFRISEWLAWGKALYVDDLICLESHRGRGFAEALMRWMEETARTQGCAQFHLDSGTHRLAAHRFYHRLKLAITSFHFQKTL